MEHNIRIRRQTRFIKGIGLKLRQHPIRLRQLGDVQPFLQKRFGFGVGVEAIQRIQRAGFPIDIKCILHGGQLGDAVVDIAEFII